MTVYRTAQVFVITMLLAGQGHTQSLKNAKVTLKAGNWSVFRTVDTMTDKMSCTGIYKTNYSVQLAADSLYLKVSGGIQSITLRFGESPVRPLRLPQKIEKEVGAVIVEGHEFAEAVETQRLRVQVLTLVRGVWTEDLDTAGLKEAVENIRAGCPEGGVIASPTRPESKAESLCTETVVSRLRAAGVTSDQISRACSVQ